MKNSVVKILQDENLYFIIRQKIKNKPTRCFYRDGKMIEVRYAKYEDYELVLTIDSSISSARWKQWTDNKQAVVAFLNNEFAGWLQYSLFMEKTPFINRLYVFEKCQRQAVGSFLLLYCEDAVRNLGFKQLMLSVEEDNTAREFYKKFGYRMLGGFDCFDNHKELMLGKELKAPVCCENKV